VYPTGNRESNQGSEEAPFTGTSELDRGEWLLMPPGELSYEELATPVVGRDRDAAPRRKLDWGCSTAARGRRTEGEVPGGISLAGESREITVMSHLR